MGDNCAEAEAVISLYISDNGDVPFTDSAALTQVSTCTLTLLTWNSFITIFKYFYLI